MGKGAAGAAASVGDVVVVPARVPTITKRPASSETRSVRRNGELSPRVPSTAATTTGGPCPSPGSSVRRISSMWASVVALRSATTSPAIRFAVASSISDATALDGTTITRGSSPLVAARAASAPERAGIPARTTSPANAAVPASAAAPRPRLPSRGSRERDVALSGSSHSRRGRTAHTSARAASSATFMWYSVVCGAIRRVASSPIVTP
jgi:hypothetical protein